MRAVAVLVALTACGDNIGGITLEDYGEARRTAECERLTRCGLFSNIEACERFVLPNVDRDIVAAIDEDKIAYDGAAAKQCLAAIAAQSCDATSEDARIAPDACTRAFAGRLDEGDACALDAECASGACATPSCPGECCMGTCLATIADAVVDGECHRDIDCADGFCGVDAHCHARIAAREMCTRDEECDFDLACIGATELEPGRCRDVPLVGEACPYMRCAEIGATCAGGTCRAVGLAPTPCATSAECSPYGECNPAGTCGELPVLGQPCTVSCSRDAWCDTDAGSCAALLPDTSPCGAGNQCESLFCEEGPVFDACAEPTICI